MPTQKRLWELRVERSGALREWLSPEQSPRSRRAASAVLRVSQSGQPVQRNQYSAVGLGKEPPQPRVCETRAALDRSAASAGLGSVVRAGRLASEGLLSRVSVVPDSNYTT